MDRLPIRPRGALVDRARFDLATPVLLACVVGSVLFRIVALPNRMSLTDGAFAAAIALGIVPLLTDSAAASVVFRRSIPALVIFLAGSILAMSDIGLAPSALDKLVRDLFVVVAFFAFWRLCESRTRLTETLLRLYLPLGLLVAGSVLVEETAYRAGGVMGVVYAAHFLMLAAVVVVMGPWGLLVKGSACGLFVLATLRTGSFGGLVIGMGAVTYLAWFNAGRLGSIGRVVRAALALGVLLLLPTFQSYLSTSGLSEDSGLDGDRYERSSTSRFDMWSDALSLFAADPRGVGPAQVREQGLVKVAGMSAEVHSDPIALLVESGPLGLAGIAYLVWLLTQSAPAGGMTRALLAGALVASLTRSTFNYRHMWIMLALALVSDQASRRFQAAPRRFGAVARARTPYPAVRRDGGDPA